MWSAPPPTVRLPYMCVAVECARPTDPQHGHLEGVLEWPAPYQAGLAYSCINGYALVGGLELRRCLLTGRWSGPEGHCQREILRLTLINMAPCI